MDDSHPSKETQRQSCFPISLGSPVSLTDQEVLKLVSEPDHSRERARIANRLHGRTPKQSRAWQEITRRFGPNVKHPELLGIAMVISENANVRLDRDAKRRKAVLIKWFDENWADVSPYLDYIVLEDPQATE
jgi:hypothetical protein